MIGRHWLKGWSRTQKAVTLSSGEAELAAMTKVAAEIIGTSNLMRDWGWEKRGVVFADSSAALGIASRKGSGKLRHIHVGLLWVQDKRENKELDFEKVKGSENPADVGTKHLSGKTLDELVGKVGLEFREGRAEKALEVSRGAK